ncbi:MAG: glycoside hydrolase [Verrucomicrobiota bacterium]
MKWCGVVVMILSVLASAQAEWFNGLTIEAPREPYTEAVFTEAATALEPNWVAVVPYGFVTPGSSDVQFKIKRQWWGESLEGTEAQIRSARRLGKKVLLKPQVWLMDGSYTGDLDFETEKEWQALEQSYRAYVFHYLESEQGRSVDAVCVGTEWENWVRKRPEFWQQLIRDIRKTYPGLLTYAANWDAYTEPPFWTELDLIGINAYFSLGSAGWKKWKPAMEDFSRKVGRPVVFTEFGYRSVERTLEEPWAEVNGRRVDNAEQLQALEKLFKTFWTEQESDWFRGGFLWKWHLRAGRKMSHGYTVQDKPAEALVREVYSQRALTK